MDKILQKCLLLPWWYFPLFPNETNEKQININSIILLKWEIEELDSETSLPRYLCGLFPVQLTQGLILFQGKTLSKLLVHVEHYSSGITPGNLNKLFRKLSRYEEKETTVTEMPFLPNG